MKSSDNELLHEPTEEEYNHKHDTKELIKFIESSDIDIDLSQLIYTILYYMYIEDYDIALDMLGSYLLERDLLTEEECKRCASGHTFII